MFTWKELEKALTKEYGNQKGLMLADKYQHSFPTGYLDDCSLTVAKQDITYIEKLSDENPLQIDFYLIPEAEFPLHIRLFQWQKPIPLSDILPMLENLDIRTVKEQPYKIVFANNQVVWISDFAIIYNKPHLELTKVKELFQEAFTKIYFGQAENDGFNKLILDASLSWREITIVRAYAKYLAQINFRASLAYIQKTLADNANITRNLISLFLLRFELTKADKNKTLIEKTTEQILSALDNVTSLDEDRIIRRILELILATLRTNYFQPDKDGEPKPYLSFKLDSRKIPEMPLPIPLYEIFIYSPRFEAIHLRYTKVARGGIRWSDRHEDFRTEILGLMKAQVVKNAIIVPSGAKGGFVLKTTKPLLTREAMQMEVLTCYKLFIGGLLDLTDNIKDKKYIRPKDVRCYDEHDAYLVVAADKGTSTFSDVANELAIEHDFWLGDAFASGGSTGYDHKKMGITARGAWESIKRHFRELNVDVRHATLTVIGIGDMSGDVFGNGLIYSKHLKLIAAFDHRNIFIDPNPDPAISYQERLRLFNLPISSWEDYNPKLISKGGGVFKRSLKSITLTPQMKTVLDVKDNSLMPNDLIKAILKAPVDLFYNGGIGTYVKGSIETQAEVGDRTNDLCRINGMDLRCKVVGEGGNLGFTQLGRIEFALKGGLINTDFIDNSAGVDCSDHEVNLKILLNVEIQKQKLTYKKRNELLADLTDEVASLVLQDNYKQALVMSFSAFHAEKNIGLHTNFIKELEALGILNREVNYIPTEKELLERKASNIGLTRPELAVLLAFTKIEIKHAILDSNLPEDPYLEKIIETAFPASIRKKYKTAISEHSLHRDIIATQLSNNVVNQMGITFVYRLQTETGASIPEIIRAHAVASHIFGTDEIQQLIESLDFKIAVSEQYNMLYNVRQLINISTRWFLYENRLKGSLQEIIDHYALRVKTLAGLTPTLMGGFTRQYLQNLTEKFIQAGVSEDIAKRIATYRAIYTSLNIIQVATKNDFDLIKTAKVYFAAGERMNLLWFRDQIANDSREGHWNTMARLTIRDELDVAQRQLTYAILKDQKDNDVQKLIDNWMVKNREPIERWEKLLKLLHSSSNIEYSMFFIAMRELLGLIMTSQTV